MKATSLKTAAVLAGTISLLAGNAMAQATTGVAGYETLPNDAGFNFVGVRLHEAPLASGTLETVTATTAEDADIDLGALIVSGTYILEIEDGSGIIQEVTSATGSVLDVMDLSGVAPGAAYTLRPASTFASVFGNVALDHALDIGAGGSGGADQVWLWNGTGFDKWYFDSFGGPAFGDETWQEVGTSGAGAVVADGNDIDLIYADGFIISSAAGKDVVITGDLKAGPTELGLVNGFNFVSSVGPVGVDLATAFGGNAADVTASGLAIGAGGSGGADQVWLWVAGAFQKIYFDSFGGLAFGDETWQEVGTSGAGAVLIPDTTALGSGYVISAAGGKDVLSDVPAFYAGL